MEKTQLTPSGIPTMSFTAKAEELEKLLTEKADVESKVADIELEIEDLLYKNKLARNENITDEALTIYLPQVKEKIEGFVYTAAKIEGRAFSELAQNPSLMKKMENKFGKKLTEFIRQVDDVFHYKAIERVREIDQIKTDKLRNDYRALQTKLNKQKINLKTVDQKITNVDRYITFCKSVVALAPVGKPQQQGQKGGQQ